MGFFSDLKEDLNQAVNELLPDGEKESEARPVTGKATRGEETKPAARAQEENDVMKEIEELEATLRSIDELQEAQAVQETEKAGREPELQEYVQETFAEVEGQLKFAAFEPEEKDAPKEPDEEKTSEAEKEPEVKKEPEKEPEKESVPESVPAPEAEKTAETPAISITADEQAKKDLRAKYDALEGEKKVDAYEAGNKGSGEGVIDKSWILDLRGMEEMDETAVITAGMRVKGDILSNGSADIFGEVFGNVQVKGKLNVTGKIAGNSKADEILADAAKINGDLISDGAVKIGIGTVVVGNVEATEAVIAGAVKGTIDVKGPVVIDATAVVLGNVRAKSMQINNGARIEGMCVLCYAEQSAAKFFEEQED